MRASARRSAAPTASIYRSDDVGRSWKRFDHGVKAEAHDDGRGAASARPEQVYGVSESAQVFGTQDGGRELERDAVAEGVGDCYAIACG